MNNKKEIKVFCTGGWDSTFMLCKLSRESIAITPIYAFNPQRQSRNQELDAIKKILRLLSNHPATKAILNKLQIVDISKIKINPTIRDARKRLATEVGLPGYGCQYDYLATIAQEFELVGLGIEKTNYDVAALAIKKFAQIKKMKYGYVPDLTKSSADVNLVFGHIVFPIIDITEREMLEWVNKNKYQSIMELTWFCHSPVDGYPCGLCRPCEQKMDAGMNFLLPKQAQKRYFKAKKWQMFGKKTSRSIKNLKLRFLSNKPKK